MADSKITALTAISTVDPTADPLVIVDVSDTSMAASGTTKKTTTNQILGSGGTATLASATITGAASAAGLTVTGSTIPTNGVYLPSANNLGFAYNSTLGMTLNANGLGVGVSPSYKLDVQGADNSIIAQFGGVGGRKVNFTTSANGGFANGFFNFVSTSSVGAFSFQNASGTLLTIDSGGNVGIGVAPSYKLDVLGPTTISGRFKTSGALNALYLEDSGTTAGSLYIGTSGNEFRIVTGSNVALAIDVNRNFTIGPTSITTTATDGFVYVPVCAGAPTGTPTAKGGRAAFVVDSTNNRFYVYVGGAWKYAALV